MLALDFINVGNGDSILVREMDAGRTRFAMLVDCGHDNLVRDDHPPLEDERSSRIYAGDFLRRQGVERLDLLLITHFHRDHIGGLGRVLDQVEVDELAAAYIPPAGRPCARTARRSLPRQPGTYCGAWIFMHRRWRHTRGRSGGSGSSPVSAWRPGS